MKKILGTLGLGIALLAIGMNFASKSEVKDCKACKEDCVVRLSEGHLPSVAPRDVRNKVGNCIDRCGDCTPEDDGLSRGYSRGN